MKWLKYQSVNLHASMQYKQEMIRTSFYIFIILFSLLISPTISQGGNELCTDEDCTCDSQQGEPDLIDVVCRCSPKKVLRIAGHSNPHNALSLPEKASSLQLEGCHHVEMFAKTFNRVSQLKNVTISGSGKLVLHPRMYEINGGTPPRFTLFEITNVHHLDVKRHAFEGISVDGSFKLMDVTIKKIPSLAFNFDFVHDFTIFGSRIDRIAMWGIKPEKCDEFNVLGGSRFFSLASNAFQLRCNKFMLAYNTFDSLLDASLNVKSGLIDIQGNTFESFTGKPFIRLETIPQKEIDNYRQGSQAGFVFRENKFKADPTLPFNALAMPAFDLVNTKDSYVNIESNHFLCDCNKVAWFLGAMTHGFDRSVIANGRGSLDFLQKLYDTSGQCLQCDLRTCNPIPGQSFRDFARTALIKHEGQLKCSASGQPLRSQKPGGGNGFDGQDGKYSDEEGLAEVKNMEWNSGLPITQASHSIRIKVVEFFSASFIIFLLSVSIAQKMIVSIN